VRNIPNINVLGTTVYCWSYNILFIFY